MRITLLNAQDETKSAFAQNAKLRETKVGNFRE